MKKGNKLIAKLLCFALVVLTVLGYGSLKAEAEELGGLRIDITNQDSANGTVFYQFFKQIPPSQIEAASLDGCGHFKIFFYIIQK